MSKPINPGAIGAFMLVGLTLLVTGILLLGGGEYFKHKSEFVIFFDSSLNGLSVGAPVKMQGVQIGTVDEIVLQAERRGVRMQAPVVVQIDPGSMVDAAGQPIYVMEQNRDQQRESLQEWIDQGIRARLEFQSLLTGLLYVDLSYHPEETPHLTQKNYRGLLEIPSIPTRADKAVNTLEGVLDSLRRVPIDQIARDLGDTIRAAKELVASNEAHAAVADLARTLEETKTMVAALNRGIGPLLQHLDATTVESKTLLSDLRHQLPGTLTQTQSVLQAAQLALQAANKASLSIEQLTGPDADLRLALREMNTAAGALRDLAEALERHPDSLLFGKPEQQ